MDRAPWADAFEVEGEPSGYIELEQVDRKHFNLNSTIRYTGERTGLEDKLSDASLESIRCVSPLRLPRTDLASVPTVLQWFVSPYGVYTPAALIHDWLVPQPSTPHVPGMKDEYADRYWRFMLKELGVPWIRRWLMWAATAARTRWSRSWISKLLLSVWLLASLCGMWVFVVAVIDRDPTMAIVAFLAPLAFAVLWGRQYGAGVVSAYSAPWILPPTIFAAAGYLVYATLEFLIGKIAAVFGSDT
jgi:hypothetical protein